MKKLLTIFLCLSICSCKQNINEKPSLTYFIATDLHYLSDSLIGEDNQIYIKENLTSDGRVFEYDNQIIDALIEESNNSTTNYLMLTGDLTLNGEKQSHIDLANKLKKANCKVLVIPGNHDVLNYNAKSYFDDYYQYISPTSYEEFKEIYQDFGYKDGYSYDENSLSYIYQTSDNTWALMLDSNMSKYNYEAGMTLVGGMIEENTYKWIEENLKYAKENNILVTSFMHHNLLVHNELFKTSYTLYNNQDIVDLLIKYNVKINFSGHLHIQSIKNYTNENNEIYDISEVSVLDYGNRYGILNFYEKELEYISKPINLSKYINNFSSYSFNVFYKEYYNKSVNKNIYKYGDKGETITNFIAKVNCYYFDGNYNEINALKIQNPELYELIKTDSEYVKSIFEIENNNQHYLKITI